MTSDDSMVQLLDPSGHASGAMSKLAAHQLPGHLHLAFSVFLFDDRGNTLLQRRAESKYHFSGLWSNSCCSHPQPDADLLTCAEVRLQEEIGITCEVDRVGRFRYRAHDPASGLVEHEEDHVLVGYVPPSTPMAPNPEEVSATRFIDLGSLRREIAERPQAFTPWLPAALQVVIDAGHPRIE